MFIVVCTGQLVPSIYFGPDDLIIEFDRFDRHKYGSRPALWCCALYQIVVPGHNNGVWSAYLCLLWCAQGN